MKSIDSKDDQSRMQFRRYALAAGGAVFGCGLSTGSVDAGIIHFDNPDLVAVGGGTEPAIAFNLVSQEAQLITGKFGGGDEALFRLLVANDGDSFINQAGKATASDITRGVAFNELGGKRLASLLGAGDTIDQDLDFSGYGYLVSDTGDFGNWAGDVPKSGFVGLSFFDADSDRFFGWARLTVDDPADTITLHEFAYENAAGVGIIAGETSNSLNPVPEPSTLAMFATGAAGLATIRRRRKAQAADI